MTEEYGQTNIGLTAFLLSVFIITIIYVIRYIRSVRAAAAATPAPAIEFQPPANDTLSRSTPSTTVIPIDDPITPPGSPRVRVLPTNVTNVSYNGGQVTNPHRRFSVHWPSIPESVR